MTGPPDTALADQTEQPAMPDAATQLAGMIFAVMLVDPDLVIRQANPATEDLLGRSAKRMIGCRLDEVLTFEDERVANSFTAAEARLLARNTLLRSGNRAGRFNLTASPLSSHEGWRVVTLSDSKQDDSGGEDGGRALRAPQVLAHEIKNPLSAIRGAGQLLARKLDDKDKPLAHMIGDEVDRIARLADRMQRLGSETPDPVAPLNLHETIRGAMATVRAADPQGAPLVEEFDPSLPSVLANGDALEQVLINLLANARDACRAAGQPQVSVQTRFVGGLKLRALLPGRSIALPIEIAVSDNGPGIDPALTDQIFEPFVSSKPQGQGLGLALVRKLLRDMNGRIVHDRDEPAGLTYFRIRIPVAQDEVAA